MIPQSPDQLADFAKSGRKQAAYDASFARGKSGDPSIPDVDVDAVAEGINDRAVPGMEKQFSDYAGHVRNRLSGHPRNLPRAEGLLQELEGELSGPPKAGSEPKVAARDVLQQKVSEAVGSHPAASKKYLAMRAMQEPAEPAGFATFKDKIRV
jgi:hypothetical protein